MDSEKVPDFPVLDSPSFRVNAGKVANWYARFLSANKGIDSCSHMAGLFNLLSMAIYAACAREDLTETERALRVQFMRPLHKALRQLTDRVGKFLQLEVS